MKIDKISHFTAWLLLTGAVIGLSEKCNDLKKCKGDNDTLTVQLNVSDSIRQELDNQNFRKDRRIDTLTYERDSTNRMYDLNLIQLQSLRHTRDSLETAVALDSTQIDSLTYAINQISARINTLVADSISLKQKNDSLNIVIASIDTTYMARYWSVVSRIDSFFIPFQPENVTIIPMTEVKKKRMFAPTYSRSGIYIRDDISKIDCIIKTQLSKIFSLPIPDSILSKKKEPINIFVAFYTMPGGKIINEQTKLIENSRVGYTTTGLLDVTKGELTISLINDSASRSARGRVSYHFEFYTMNSSKPFYQGSFITR